MKKMHSMKYLTLMSLAFASFALSGCVTGRGNDESEPTLIEAPEPTSEVVEAADPATPPAESKQQEGEVPLAVAES